MSDTASSVSTWRCPYKNVEDRCTASFGQQFDTANVLAKCTGSDDLDYRGAWEV